MPLDGRSRTCPMDAFTMKSSPRYLLIVLALAGDSTITRFLPFFLAISNASFLDAAAAALRPSYRRFPGKASRSDWLSGLGSLPYGGRQCEKRRQPCQADAPTGHLVVRAG